MKKTIFLFAIIMASALVAFVSPPPAATPMQFETLGTNIYQLPTPTANGKWSWNFIAWYGVKDNPYTVVDTTATGMVTNATWAKWVNLTMITSTTDAPTAIAVSEDSANAYRLRIYPDIK